MDGYLIHDFLDKANTLNNMYKIIAAKGKHTCQSYDSYTGR